MYIVKYEDLLVDSTKELQKTIEFLRLTEVSEEKLKRIVDDFSFKSQSKRKPGEQNKQSFLRKGISGDWKNNFTKRAALVFHEFAGKELIKSGYEKDDSWVSQDFIK